MEHHFDVEVAKKYGLEEAIIIYHINYWISKNKANNKHFHDGRYWTYNSMKAFQELFPYLSYKQIRRTLEKLRANNVLITAKYNSLKYDNTLWYSFSDEFVIEMQKGQTDFPKTAKGIAQEGTPIPDNKPDNKPDKENVKRKIDLSFVDESFLDDFILWLTYKRERGQEYKGETSIRICYKKLMKLADNNFNTAREIIEQSIASNYQGLFKLKTDNGNSRNNFKTSTERLNDVYQEWYNRVFAKYETQSGVSDEVLSPEEDNLPF